MDYDKSGNFFLNKKENVSIAFFRFLKDLKGALRPKINAVPGALLN